MKRRSARPFMVEVKGARTARAAQTTAGLRTRPDTNLWQDLAQETVKPPQPDIPSPAPQPARKEAEAPVRRVLPSLVPMFQVPEPQLPESQGADSQGADEASPESERGAEPRARRGRPRGTRAAPTAPAAAPAARPRPEPAAAAPIVVPEPAEPDPVPSPKSLSWRRTKELRLGERWKRRLPHYAR
ncbi:MAG: hypothetical protein INR70_22510 [Parafilimonas terrae]|nr:hypothetical protein [Parafilimonas terrae]